MSIQAEIDNAIAEDKKYRYKGVTEGLYPIESLAPSQPRVSDVKYPIVFRHNCERTATVRTSAEFAKVFAKRCPELASFDLKSHGVVLAGGAISALTDGSKREFDYDLFFVGIGEAKAHATIRALGNHLLVNCPKLKVYRTMNAITFVDANSSHGYQSLKIQLIMRLYATVAEVIHGFDLGSSAAAWDGQTVQYTALGKLAYERSLNVVNLSVRRWSYERRLVKYIDCGFGIVLPGADPKKIEIVVNAKKNSWIHFSRLSMYATQHTASTNVYVCYASCRGTDRLNGTQQSVNMLLRQLIGRMMPPAADAGPATDDKDTPDLDYEWWASVGYGSTNLNAMHTANIYAKDGSKMCAVADYELDMAVVMIQPKVPKNVLKTLTYDSIGGKAAQLARLFSIYSYSVAMWLTAAALDGNKERLNKEADVAIEERYDELAKTTIPFQFKGVEEGTALQGPFRRSPMTDKEWYGEFAYSS